MEKQIDQNTRIKFKFYLPALGFVFCLQRKHFGLWITKSWVYESCLIQKNYNELEQYLFWEESIARKEPLFKRVKKYFD